MTDVYLGSDGLASDEATTSYRRRGDRLIARCQGEEREVDPAEQLDRCADINREWEGRCRQQGFRGPTLRHRRRADVQARTAAAIRAAFGLDRARQEAPSGDRGRDRAGLSS
jgi:hypothetical protein